MTLFLGNLVVFNTFRVPHRDDGKIPPSFCGSGVGRIECIVILSILQGGHFPFVFIFLFFIYNLASVPIHHNWTSNGFNIGRHFAGSGIEKSLDYKLVVQTRFLLLGVFMSLSLLHVQSRGLHFPLVVIHAGIQLFRVLC